MARHRTKARLFASVAAAALAGLAWMAGPWRAAAAEPATQEPEGGSAATGKFYRGPGERAFKDGHHAWELGDWKKAQARMTEALEADPDRPDVLVKTGGSAWICPYIPTYYLSLARCKQNECPQAKDTDEVLWLIKDASNHYRRRYVSDCQKRCPPATPP